MRSPKTTLDYLEKAKKADKPFFLWWNSTRMHINTHLKPESEGKTGLGVYPDGMVEHDGHVGQILDKFKALGLDDNTIVMYSTDNGAECFSWPDGGTTPFRGEKNENWEGGYRVPCAIRWPGVIKPGTVNNDLFSHEDMLPTLLAAAGVPDVKEQLRKGMKVGKKTFKVHLDGYNITDRLAGKGENPRQEFFYWNDDGSLVGLRYSDWKVVFQEQRSEGFDVWQDPFTPLRLPKIINLRTDPFESGRADRHRLRQVENRPHVPARAGAGVRRASTSARSRSFRRARRSAASRSIRCWKAQGGKNQREVNARDSRRSARPPLRPVALRRRDDDGVAAEVQDFYERYPYPRPVVDLEDYRRRWQDRGRRRADFHLFWPDKPYREDQRSSLPAAEPRRRPSTRCAGRHRE